VFRDTVNLAESAKETCGRRTECQFYSQIIYFLCFYCFSIYIAVRRIWNILAFIYQYLHGKYHVICGKRFAVVPFQSVFQFQGEFAGVVICSYALA